MAKVKGMLMQKSGSKGVVMTDSGEFINVLLLNQPFQLGQEVEAVVWQQRKQFKYLITVAAVILMVLLIPGYHSYYTNQALAFVALDINPSIELAIDKDMKIIKAKGLNTEGKKIVSEVKVTKIPLYQALPILVDQAITDGYLEFGHDNVVLSTVTITEGSDAIKIEETKLQQAISKPIQDHQIEARVVIEQSGNVERQEAKKAGLSAGKYLIYKEAQKQGISVTVDEVRSQGIYQLEQKKKVKVDQMLKKQLSPKNINASKQQLYKIIDRQLPPGDSAEMKQMLDQVIQQVPAEQYKKFSEQNVTPEQVEQLQKQLQDLKNNPEKYKQQVRGIITQFQSNKRQIIEQPLNEQKQEEQHRELDIKQNKKLPPGLEKKLELKQYPLPDKYKDKHKEQYRDNYRENHD
jgi:hypothetical protein